MSGIAILLGMSWGPLRVLPSQRFYIYFFNSRQCQVSQSCRAEDRASHRIRPVRPSFLSLALTPHRII